MTEQHQGRFVWYELMTTDPKGAIAFYTEVVGWKTQPYQGEDYTMWVGSQGPLGGTTLLPDEAKKMGAPPHWMANVQVADVDRAVAKVKELGGRVYAGPFDVPEIGRVAVIGDPQGAVLAVFAPSNDMAAHDPSKPGEFCWRELATSDHEAAFRFYSALFGWERLSDFDMGPSGIYLIYGRQGQQLGGMFTATGEMKLPPTFIYYVETDDLAAALERATRAGGRVLNGPMEVPGGAHIAQLMDPQGAVFALHHSVKG